jgi:hypothetical protein
VQYLPVDAAHFDALAHADRALTLTRAETVELHPRGERELRVFAGNIQPHAIAHAAELQRALARPAAFHPVAADDRAGGYLVALRSGVAQGAGVFLILEIEAQEQIGVGIPARARLLPQLEGFAARRGDAGLSRCPW